MNGFSYLHEFHNGCDNQYNPYDFTLNSYGYYNNNLYMSNTYDPISYNSNFAPQNLHKNKGPTVLESILKNREYVLKNNPNSYSLQILNDYNPCQNNFEFQNGFQNQNGNINHSFNNFDNGNNFNNGGSENFYSQQSVFPQNENHNSTKSSLEKSLEAFLLSCANLENTITNLD